MTFLLAVLCQCLSVTAQENQGQKVKVYRNGQVTHQLTIDSVTVTETTGPVIPGRNILILGEYYDESYEFLYRRSVLLNGIEMSLEVPDDPNPEFPYNYLNAYYDGTDLYILGYRQIRDPRNSGINQRYVVWKNFEFQYDIITDLYGSSAMGCVVDNGNVYIYGRCWIDANYERERGFYIKNQGRPITTSYILSGFGVYNDEVSHVVQRYVSTSYHSKNKSWSSALLWQLFLKGETSLLQSGDLSKRHWIQDMKLRDGIPYIVGYTDEFDDNGQLNYSVAYYNGSTFSNISLSQYEQLEGRLITFDDQGNVYLLCYAEKEHVYVVLKNGSFQFELSATEGFDVHNIVDRNNHGIAVDGADVYVSGREISQEKDNNGDKTYNGLLWKNGEIIWRRVNGRINNILIY